MTRFTKIWQRALLPILAITLLISAGCSRTAKASRHLTRADQYFAAEQYDKAELEYLNVLRLDKTNSTAIRNLGLIYFSQDLTMQAAAFLNSVKAANSNDVHIRSKLAQVYYAGGAITQAVAEAEFVLQNQPTNELALFVLIEAAKKEELKALEQRLETLRQKSGDQAVLRVAQGFVLLRQNDLKNAEAEFKSAVALDPNSSTPHWGLATFYLTQTNRTLAEPSLSRAAELSPIRSNRRLKLIDLKSQAGDLPAAKTLLAEILQKAPDYPPAWVYSARFNLAEKKFADALADLQRVLGRNPNNYDAQVLLAEVYIAEGKFDKAVEALDTLNNRFPKSPSARFQLALACLLNKDLPRAVTALNQAVALEPNFSQAILLLAELNVRRGEPASAIAAMTEFLKKQPQAEKAHLILASAYQTSGRLDDAIAVYQRALPIFPNSTQVPLLLGIALRQQSKDAAARQVFASALQKSPDNPPLILQLVDLDLRENKHQAAIDRVQQQIEKYPNEPEPLFLMARVRLAQNDLANAEPLLLKVIELDPDRTPAYLLLARLYLQGKKVQPALEKLESSLARNPKDAAAMGMIAIIHSQKGDHAKAREVYEKLLQIAPNSILALNNLANIYAENLGQLDKAYELARKAEQLRPNDPKISDTFAWILSRRGEYKLALNLLRESVRALPAEPEVLAHLGITYYLSGDEAPARDALDRALKMSADFPGRPEVEKCLSILNINPGTADAKIRSTLEQRVAEQPVDVVALRRLAVIYQRENQLERMIPLYEKALATNPRLALPMARLAHLYAERTANTQKALELARNARNLEPDNPEVARLAGRAAGYSGELKDQQWGLSLLVDSAQREKGNAETLHYLGLANFSQGRLAEAESSLKAALAADPAFPAAADAKRLLELLPLYNNPALAAQAQGKVSEILNTDPNYLPALAVQALALQETKPAEAEAAFEKVLARYPGFAPAIRSLALLTSSRPADPKALSYANRARELYPQDPEVAKLLGLALYHQKDYAKSARLLAESAQKNAEDAQLQFYLGMAHYQLKQNPQSKAALEKAVQLQANAAFVPEAKRVLAELN